jgi:hypothetical protein
MELASMLSGEPFSDRPPSSSPVVAALLRTYNDGLDDQRRQDLYPFASMIVGTAGARRVERDRVSRCLEFARGLGASPPSGRAAIGVATPEVSGSLAALAALRSGPTEEIHRRTLAFARELMTLEPRGRLWRWSALPVGRDPGRAVADALADGEDRVAGRR